MSEKTAGTHDIPMVIVPHAMWGPPVSFKHLSIVLLGMLYGVSSVHPVQHEPSIDPITEQVIQVQGNFDKDTWFPHFVLVENQVSWKTEVVVSSS